MSCKRCPPPPRSLTIEEIAPGTRTSYEFPRHDWDTPFSVGGWVGLGFFCWDNIPKKKGLGFFVSVSKWMKELVWLMLSNISPNSVVNTWGSYGSSKKPGCLDRGGGHIARGIHRYFRGFVLACSFRLWIFVLSGWRRPAPAGFVCKFS